MTRREQQELKRILTVLMEDDPAVYRWLMLVIEALAHASTRGQRADADALTNALKHALDEGERIPANQHRRGPFDPGGRIAALAARILAPPRHPH